MRLSPELTGRQAMALLARLRGGVTAEEQAAALDRAGLTAAANRTLARYSRGMLRRFGLAQAFLGQPDLVLLDEPTAGLDAPGLTALADWTGELRERGGTLVVSSHAIGDLITHSDRLCLLWQGRVALEGPTGDLLRDRETRGVRWHAGPEAATVLRFLREQGAQGAEHAAGWRSLGALYAELERKAGGHGA
ncbi:MAG: ATP-binding cassette domain-containing protein [Planctomycetota bacterium]